MEVYDGRQPALDPALKHAHEPAQPRYAIWPGLLIATAVLLLLLLYWAAYIRLPYFPAGDEFSLLVHSTRSFHPSAAEWFRHGFSGYFEPYPDLSVPYSNFLRPVANLTYFVQSLFFGQQWSLYLLGNYAIIGATVMVVWHLARRCLRLSTPWATAVAIAAAVCPAVSYQAVLRPSFAFDLLGALWALLALAALLGRRWWLAGLFVLLAVLTKETAYYAAPAAALTAFLLLRQLPTVKRIMAFAVYLVPLVLVAVLRKVDFAGGQGVYVLNQMAGTSAAKRLILALTHWPYMLPGEQHIFELSLHNLSALLITGLSWGLLLFFTWTAIQLASREAQTSAPGTSTAPAATALLVFLAGSLLLPVGLDLAPRFGASVYPLLFLSFGLLADKQRFAPVRFAAAAVLLVATAVNATMLIGSLFGPELTREQLLWARSRVMVQDLASEQQPVVFLLADASESFSSPTSVKRFAGYQGTIVPVSNLDVAGCQPGSLQIKSEAQSQYAFQSYAGKGCPSNSLGATFHLTPRREQHFVRDLPQAEIAYTAHDGGWQDGQFSAKQLDIVLTSRVPAYAILVPRSQSAADLERLP